MKLQFKSLLYACYTSRHEITVAFTHMKENPGRTSLNILSGVFTHLVGIFLCVKTIDTVFQSYRSCHT